MFIVVELQVNNGEVSTILTQYTDERDAEAKFHQILQYASKSAVDIHSAVIMDETGMTLRQESYTKIINEE